MKCIVIFEGGYAVYIIFETLGDGFGGRVELTKQYHQALDASVARNFPDNGCIACMSHSKDALYYLLRIWNMDKCLEYTTVKVQRGARLRGRTRSTRPTQRR